MQRLIHRLRTNDFLRHNGILFAGSLAVSALNYAYYPILGRLLSTAQFGEVQALVSLFLQATIFFTVVTNVAVNVVANQADEDLRNRTVREMEYVTLLVTLVVLLVLAPLGGMVQKFLQFDDPGPFLVLAAALVVGAPLAVRTAYLRGRLAFGAVSAVNITASLAKIICSVGFVLLGWQTIGAIGGVLAAQLVALVYAARRAAQLGLTHHGGPYWRRPDFGLIRPHMRYSLLVLVVSLVMTILFSCDVLLAKHYFDPRTAGLYAGVATVGRIIFFVTGSIAAVLLASVKLGEDKRRNQQLLKRSIVLQLSIGGSVLMVFAVAPQIITRLLIGAKYDSYTSLLPELSLALSILAFVNLLLTYDLALRRTSAPIIAVLGVVVTIAIIGSNHQTPAALVRSLLIGTLVLFCLRVLDSLRRRLA